MPSTDRSFMAAMSKELDFMAGIRDVWKVRACPLEWCLCAVSCFLQNYSNCATVSQMSGQEDESDRRQASGKASFDPLTCSFDELGNETARGNHPDPAMIWFKTKPKNGNAVATKSFEEAQRDSDEETRSGPGGDLGELEQGGIAGEKDTAVGKDGAVLRAAASSSDGSLNSPGAHAMRTSSNNSTACLNSHTSSQAWAGRGEASTVPSSSYQQHVGNGAATSVLYGSRGSGTGFTGSTGSTIHRFESFNQSRL
jgi:hypothetical protein